MDMIKKTAFSLIPLFALFAVVYKYLGLALISKLHPYDVSYDHF